MDGDAPKTCDGTGNKILAQTKPANRPIGKDGKPLKPCCVCLDTKGVRDECIINKGEENCLSFIEAHKQCLRDLGFKI